MGDWNRDFLWLEARKAVWRWWVASEGETSTWLVERDGARRRKGLMLW